MRIAHLLWNLNTGGIQSMLVDIVNEQVKTCNVAIFVVNNIINPSIVQSIDNNVRIYFCNRSEGSRNLLPLLKLNLHLFKYSPDVLHCHDDRLTKIIIYRCPLVRTIHNTHSNPEDFAKYKYICCISNAVKDYTSSQGFPNGIVVYNGIHTEQISTNEKCIYSRDNKHLVCVGRLHPMKGQDIIVEAFNILVNQRGYRNCTIDLIGDGVLRSVLEEKINKYGLNSFVKLLGSKPRSYFYPILCEYDAFVMPSVNEGFGLTLAEACAAKIPVISSDLKGPMEVICNGKYGFSFRTGNPQSLADSIEFILNNEVDPQMIQDAFDYVVRNFDVCNTAKKYIDIYIQSIN